MNNQRRQFLKHTALTAALLATYPALLQANMPHKASKASADFQADVELELTQEAMEIAIFSGSKTSVWKVSGKVLKGAADAVKNNPESYLAPTLHLHKGQKVRIYLKNKLPAQSILHWHGLHVPADMDGNPMYAINTGESFVYEFEVRNRAGTYWYHAHTHGVTARQVYSGLAGLLIVSDPEEQALNLPRGEFDIGLAIQDRSFDAQNQLHYRPNMMQKMQGFLGDQIFINGRPDFVLNVATRAYRLRLLNGSNSRLYKLAWDDGSVINVIGVDGGLLEHPVQVPYLMLAPGERRELWVDFSDKALNTELTLRSKPFEASSPGGMMGGMGNMGGMGRRGMMGMGMMGGGMGASAKLPLGGDYPLLKIRVNKKSAGSGPLPKQLTAIKPLKLTDAANSGQARQFSLSMQHMSALLNGRSYKMDDIRPDEIMPLNTVQLIEFDNGYEGGHGMGMHMAMPHPMHLHGEQFQIVKREVKESAKSDYASVANGLIDSGWHDTVLVMPGEKITVLKPFNDYAGIFMVHCHNLEHEDMGMMRDLLVQ
ncbi:MAG: multicopper oxidase domain-containing protein [Methylococcales bacterium]